MKIFLKNYWVLACCILFLSGIKIQHLHFPVSWDEAWSYYPAILKMAENGPSLIPGSIPLFSSKGHPLLFYFLESGWITIFSDQFWVARLLPLILSAVTLVVLHHLAKTHFSERTANLSVVVYSVQSMFLAQATLILPEVLLSLLLLLSLHFFLSKKFWLYAIFSSLMILTKETGLIFAALFGVHYLATYYREIRQKTVQINTLFLLVPLFVFIVHLLLNYRAFHTFFFAEHLRLMSFNTNEITRILKSSSAILFTMSGRNAILGIAGLSLVFMFAQKRDVKNGRGLLLLLVLIVVLIVFSTVNFYTYRYMLPALPLFVLLSTELLVQATVSHKVLRFIGLAVMVAPPLYSTLTSSGKLDVDFGYAQYLPLQTDMVAYCEKQDWDEKIFVAQFNMALALRDPFTGYHSRPVSYKIQFIPDFKNADIVILDSTGNMKTLPENEKEKFTLVKRFENKNHWGEIYVRKKIMPGK